MKQRHAWTNFVLKALQLQVIIIIIKSYSLFGIDRNVAPVRPSLEGMRIYNLCKTIAYIWQCREFLSKLIKLLCFILRVLRRGLSRVIV